MGQGLPLAVHLPLGERGRYWACWAAWMEFIITVRSPLVGFFMPTGTSGRWR